MTTDQLLEDQPNANVICENGEAFVEISARILSENGFGLYELMNPQNAGPFLLVSSSQMSSLKELCF